MTAGGWQEANFDGLVGPTHNYGGLSPGNLASHRHRGRVASPRAAALQGLAKMKRLADLGLPQAVLPPAPRPAWSLWRRCGYTGAAAGAIAGVAGADRLLLHRAYSASSMWAANAATVIPSPDSADGRVHLVPANLHTMLHRAVEAPFTERLLARLFAEAAHFAVHPALPGHPLYADEGAANHMRLAPHHGAPGAHVWVYGRAEDDAPGTRPGRYPARQTREAAAAHRHRLADPARGLLVRQASRAIEAGVFHNDVIALSHLDRLLYHEQAYGDAAALRGALERLGAGWLRVREIGARELSLPDAVRAYLFNSQLVSPPAGPGMLLLAPEECRQVPAARALLERLTDEGWLDRVAFTDLRQSMQNGGGPACLRLRVVLDEVQRRAVRGRIWLDDALYADLTAWVRRHYRDRLAPEDLRDPALADEVRAALDELQRLLELDGLYDGED